MMDLLVSKTVQRDTGEVLPTADVTEADTREAFRGVAITA